MRTNSNQNLPVLNYIFKTALVFLVFTFAAFAQDTAEASADLGGDPTAGKQLFNQNCAACHALNRKMTGPALANVETRLSEDEGLDKEWLYAWIKNSAGMIASGDAYANKIYNEYNKAAMTAFPTLSNADIDNFDSNGWTALHHASFHGDLLSVNLLKNAGANINALSN